MIISDEARKAWEWVFLVIGIVALFAVVQAILETDNTEDSMHYSEEIHAPVIETKDDGAEFKFSWENNWVFLGIEVSLMLVLWVVDKMIGGKP